MYTLVTDPVFFYSIIPAIIAGAGALAEPGIKGTGKPYNEREELIFTWIK